MVEAWEGASLVRARGGDRAAFGELVRHYQDRVFAFLMRMLGNRDEAMDLTQDTFMKAYLALPQWQPQAQFNTWLFLIARNAAIDLLRRRGREQLTSLDDEEMPADAAPTPEQQLDATRRIGLLSRSLDKLPAEQREVLLLREIEDMSYAEIATVLAVNEGTVKSRLARARVAALAHYRQYAGEDGNG